MRYLSVSNRKWYNFLVIRVRSALSGGAYRIRMQRAEEEGIVCECQVDLKEIPAVDDIDLCVLFANTLDNAIEACSKMKERQNRHISVKARCMGGQFSYEIINSKENTEERWKSAIQTRLFL